MSFQGLRRWWPLAAVVLLVLAAALSAAYATPQLDRLPDGSGQGEPKPTLAQPSQQPQLTEPQVSRAAEGIDVPGWLPAVIYTLLALFLAALAVIVLWSLVEWCRGRFGRADEEASGEQAATARTADADVLGAVDAGLADLSDTDTDPRRAVIACWVRLEEVARQVGIPRGPGDTSTDLVVRLLSGLLLEGNAGRAKVGGEDPGGENVGGENADGHNAFAHPRPVAGVNAEVLTQFADAYREARYATHTIDERMRDQAHTALRRLRAELTSLAVL